MSRSLSEERNLRALTALNLLRGAAVGGFMTLLPMYMKSLGYSMKSIGGVISLSSIALGLALPLIGYLNDKRGPRLMVIASTALLALAPVLAAFTASLEALGLAYAIFLFSFLSGQPARMSFLAASVPGTILGTAIGLSTGAFSASRTAGPALAGYLAARYSYRAAFLALTLLAVAGLLVFALTSRPVHVERRPRSPIEAYRSLLRPPRPFAAVLALVSIDRVAWSLWFPLLSAHLYASGYPEDLAGLMITGSGVVQTLSLPLAGRVTDKSRAWRVLVQSELLGAMSALLLADPSSLPRAALGLALLGASIAFWIPSYNTLIARVAGGSGASFAAANTARSLVSAPFPYIGGRLYDVAGPSSPFVASVLVMLAATAWALLVVSRFEASVSMASGIPPSVGGGRASSPHV